MTRPEIIGAALKLSGDDGLAVLSMRRLASALDVSPMALYRHVADKSEILLEVVDALLAAQQLPSESPPWRDYLRQIAVLLRRLLKAEPVALRVFAQRPVVTAAARARFIRSVTVLTDAGFTEDDATRAYATLHTYTLGFCLLEQGRESDAPPAPVSVPLSEHEESARIAAFVSEEQFLHGLDVIIAGIAS